MLQATYIGKEMMQNKQTVNTEKKMETKEVEINETVDSLISRYEKIPSISKSHKYEYEIESYYMNILANSVAHEGECECYSCEQEFYKKAFERNLEMNKWYGFCPVTNSVYCMFTENGFYIACNKKSDMYKHIREIDDSIETKIYIKCIPIEQARVLNSLFDGKRNK